MGLPVFDFIGNSLINNMFGDIHLLGIALVFMFMLFLFALRMPKLMMLAFMLPVITVMAMKGSPLLQPYVAIILVLMISVVYAIAFFKAFSA